MHAGSKAIEPAPMVRPSPSIDTWNHWHCVLRKLYDQTCPSSRPREATLLGWPRGHQHLLPVQASTMSKPVVICAVLASIALAEQYLSCDS